MINPCRIARPHWSTRQHFAPREMRWLRHRLCLEHLTPLMSGSCRPRGPAEMTVQAGRQRPFHSSRELLVLAQYIVRLATTSRSTWRGWRAAPIFSSRASGRLSRILCQRGLRCVVVARAAALRCERWPSPTICPQVPLSWRLRKRPAPRQGGGPARQPRSHSPEPSHVQQFDDHCASPLESAGLSERSPSRGRVARH